MCTFPLLTHPVILFCRYKSKAKLLASDSAVRQIVIRCIVIRNASDTGHGKLLPADRHSIPNLDTMLFAVSLLQHDLIRRLRFSSVPDNCQIDLLTVLKQSENTVVLHLIIHIEAFLQLYTLAGQLLSF